MNDPSAAVGATFWTVVVLAVTTAVVHTFTGPDHYLPFIVLSKARKWTLRKTLGLTFASGLGHVGSAILLALVFNCFQEKFASWGESIDETRGSLAAWLLLILGCVYMAWGLFHLFSHRRHRHAHLHADGTVHIHDHTHDSNGVEENHGENHAHLHGGQSDRLLLGWSLFIIFVLGPCEALLPILAASAAVGKTCLFVSTVLFSAATIISMLAAVVLGYFGVRTFNAPWFERVSHLLAGLVIALCGAGMIWLGL